MQRTAARVLILLLILPLASVTFAQDKPLTPAEQFQALRKEYDRTILDAALEQLIRAAERER